MFYDFGAIEITIPNTVPNTIPNIVARTIFPRLESQEQTKTNMDQMMPLLLLDDGKTDMKNLFLMTTMMQNNCEDTNGQMNMLLPHLLLRDDKKDFSMKSQLD